jgi:hypothetical protein
MQSVSPDISQLARRPRPRQRETCLLLAAPASDLQSQQLSGSCQAVVSRQLSQTVVTMRCRIRLYGIKAPPAAATPKECHPAVPGRTTTLRAAWRPCSVVAGSDGQHHVEGAPPPGIGLYLALLGASVLSDQVRQLAGVRTAGPACRLDL